MSLDSDKSSIVQCNIFDSRSKYINLVRSKERRIKCFQLEYIVEANGCAIINNNEYKLASNTIVFAKPNQLRWSKLHFRCFAIHFQIDQDDPYYSLLLNCPDFYPLPSSKKYADIFSDIIYYVNIKQFNLKDDILKAKILELFYLLIEEKNINFNVLANAPKNTTTSLLDSILYINEHYEENLKLEYLAKLTHYSPTYYQQLFTRLMHCSPQQYILQKRIEAAKQLLTTSQLSMIDIAYQCGFSSQSYFCYIFKKETSMSPLQYKKLGMGNFIL